MSPEEIRNAALAEIHNLVEKLPLAQLQSLKDEAAVLLAKVASNPEVQEAESRFKTIAKHLWNAILTGEHAVVTDVHNFLLARGRIVPFTPVPAADAGNTAEAPAPTL